MKIKSIITTMALMAALNGTQAQDNIKLIVGTYTDGTSKGVYSFNFNQATGTAAPIDTLAMPNPSFITISHDGSRIYAVNENNDETAAVSTIAFDSKTGKMELLGTQKTCGADPCYVETNGKTLLTANYTGGSMSVFPIQTDGTAGEMKKQFRGGTGGTFMPNQQQAHIHTAVFTPEGRHVLATDFSADRILCYEITDSNSIRLQGVAGTVEPGAGPRHIAFSPDGRFFYVIGELSGSINVFGWYGDRCRRVETVQADTVGGHGSADIHIAPNGRYLYASNRLKNDGIAVFCINRRTGALTPAGYANTGRHPRNFGITPNGKYLLCACRDDNKIQVFRINPANGMPEDTHQDILVDKAVCVKFYPPVQ